MPKFIAVYQQSEGCDYTIGCGICVDELTATTLPLALKEAEAEVASHTDEFKLSEATVYEVLTSHKMDVPAIYAALAAKEKRREAARVKEEELAQLAALQAKYGKAPA